MSQSCEPLVGGAAFVLGPPSNATPLYSRYQSVEDYLVSPLGQGKERHLGLRGLISLTRPSECFLR